MEPAKCAGCLPADRAETITDASSNADFPHGVARDLARQAAVIYYGRLLAGESMPMPLIRVTLPFAINWRFLPLPGPPPHSRWLLPSGGFLRSLIWGWPWSPVFGPGRAGVHAGLFQCVCALPIGLVMSYLILGVVYYLVTPTGLILGSSVIP